MKQRNYKKIFLPFVLFCVVFFILFGWLILYSSYFYNFTFIKQIGEITLLRSLLFRTIFGVLGFFFFVLFPLRLLKNLRAFLISACFILLLSVMLLGVEKGEAKRWVDMGFIQMQPFELFRIFFLLYLSSFLADNRGNLWKIKFILPLTFSIVFFVLVILQPNFSSAIFILFLTGMLFFLEGMPLRYIFIIGILFFMMGMTGVKILPHAKARMEVYFNEQGEHYQIVQSKIAVAGGGFFGKGIGKGEIKYKYLPQLTTDFIFALVAEETGFLGASLLILLYFLFVSAIFLCSYYFISPFYRILVQGIALSFFYYIIVHIGVNLGLFPPTGLPLPFLSFGGSSFFANCSLLGLFLRSFKEDKQTFIMEEKNRERAYPVITLYRV